MVLIGIIKIYVEDARMTNPFKFEPKLSCSSEVVGILRSSVSEFVRRVLLENIYANRETANVAQFKQDINHW